MDSDLSIRSIPSYSDESEDSLPVVTILDLLRGRLLNNHMSHLLQYSLRCILDTILGTEDIHGIVPINVVVAIAQEIPSPLGIHSGGRYSITIHRNYLNDSLASSLMIYLPPRDVVSLFGLMSPLV